MPICGLVPVHFYVMHPPLLAGVYVHMKGACRASVGPASILMFPQCPKHTMTMLVQGLSSLAHIYPITQSIWIPLPPMPSTLPVLQEVVISALSPAKSLNVADVKRQLDLLREAVQGGLGLGSGGKASRGQQVGRMAERVSLGWALHQFHSKG